MTTSQAQTAGADVGAICPGDRAPEVLDAVQADGTCWMSGTVWDDRAAMRISVSNWSTTDDDVDRSVDAILRIHRDLT